MDDEAGAGDRRHDLTEPPEPLVLLLARRLARELEVAPADVDDRTVVEVVLTPVRRAVDARCHRVVVVRDQQRPRLEGTGNPARPSIEVVYPVKDAAARVD